MATPFPAAGGGADQAAGAPAEVPIHRAAVVESWHRPSRRRIHAG
jgi:hypothetical protein